MAFGLSRRPGSEAKRSTTHHAEDNRAAGARAQKEEKREKQNTCLYVCSIYPPFPIIVSIWETARKIMKQSFVNINSFTSQKKIVIFCFCFTKLEKKTNRQRKVLKSLVICNYASKKATTNHTKNSQTERTRTQTRAFLFLFDSSHLFYCGSMRERKKNRATAAVRHLWVFFIFVSLEEGLPEESRSRFLPRIGFIFSSKIFGFHTRCLLTKTVCSKT